MTGPNHYREAEQLIERAHTLQSDHGPGCGSEEELAEAQVHATLALAAATALEATDRRSYIPEARGWEKVLPLHVEKETDR